MNLFPTDRGGKEIMWQLNSPWSCHSHAENHNKTIKDNSTEQFSQCICYLHLSYHRRIKNSRSMKASPYHPSRGWWLYQLLKETTYDTITKLGSFPLTEWATKWIMGIALKCSTALTSLSCCLLQLFFFDLHSSLLSMLSNATCQGLIVEVQGPR